jgi:RP/EB family microtubule-associated protein
VNGDSNLFIVVVTKRPSQPLGRLSNANINNAPLSKIKASSTPSINEKQLNELNQQVSELTATVEGLEKERDFYFGKLRDIEILVQAHTESAGPNGEGLKPAEAMLMKQIQDILYSTEVNKGTVFSLSN